MQEIFWQISFASFVSPSSPSSSLLFVLHYLFSSIGCPLLTQFSFLFLYSALGAEICVINSGTLRADTLFEVLSPLLPFIFYYFYLFYLLCRLGPFLWVTLENLSLWKVSKAEEGKGWERGKWRKGKMGKKSRSNITTSTTTTTNNKQKI